MCIRDRRPTARFGTLSDQRHGALASPAVLENLSLDQIASDLGDPSNPVAQVVDGSANYIIASLCSIAGSPDVPICSASFVTQAQTSMTKTTN